jgi:hypothetical protein
MSPFFNYFCSGNKVRHTYFQLFDVQQPIKNMFGFPTKDKIFLSEIKTRKCEINPFDSFSGALNCPNS